MYHNIENFDYKYPFSKRFLFFLYGVGGTCTKNIIFLYTTQFMIQFPESKTKFKWAEGSRMKVLDLSIIQYCVVVVSVSRCYLCNSQSFI